MNSLRHFLRNFINNKGQYVFTAMLVKKICAFIGAWLIIRLLSESDFGKISIVAAVFNVVAAGSGMGLPQSLLHFGAGKKEKDKRVLARTLLWEGFRMQLVLTVLFLLVAIFYIPRYTDIFIIFLFFGIRLIGTFFFDHIQIQQRIDFKNKAFSILNIIMSLLGLVFIFVGSMLWGWVGYLVAIAITPYLSLFWLKNDKVKSLPRKLIWHGKIGRYARYAVFNGLLSDLLLAADVIILSFLLHEKAVADYRVGIMIPRNLVFFSLVFMKSDFALIAKHYTEASFLKSYVANYYKIFIPVVLAFFFVFFMLRKDIVGFIFGVEYMGLDILFTIFLLTFLGNILMRNLYGNLLSAVGRMFDNVKVSVVAIVVLVVLGLVWVPRFQTEGMAFSLLCSMGVSGAMSAYYFWKYMKTLKP